MGANSKIEWTNHTFNGIRGCTKVSPGCANCYAETGSGRNPKVLGEWGPEGTRVVGTDAYWDEPLKWDREAAESGERRRVFAYSLADVFEADATAPRGLVDVKGERLYNHVDVNASAIDGSVPATLDNARARLFRLALRTPNLDWLWLTKRADNILPSLRRLYEMFGPDDPERAALWKWLREDDPPANIWLGVSVENRRHGLPRVDLLREVPAVVRFLSVEPMLEDLGDFDLNGIHWVIGGGESGSNARPVHLEWARRLRDRCVAAGVPFFWKQWGEWQPEGQGPEWLRDVIGGRNAHPNRALLPDGTHLPDLTGRGTNGDGAILIRKMGKKKAGRRLDGLEWNQLPYPNVVA